MSKKNVDHVDREKIECKLKTKAQPQNFDLAHLQFLIIVNFEITKLEERWKTFNNCFSMNF